MEQANKVIIFREITTPAKLGQWCVLTGNPADGFTVWGPFATHGEAEAWAEYSGESWWIMELDSPGDGLN